MTTPLPEPPRKIVVSAGTDALVPASRLAAKEELPLAYIREGGAKAHGTMRRIEGRPQPGDIAILIVGQEHNEVEARQILEGEGIQVSEVRYCSFHEEVANVS